MKYIDADKLKDEIERRKQVHFDDYFIKKSGNPADYGASNALAQVLSFIDSLQQEQPSFPSNLDEAAEEYLKHHKLETASITKLSMYRSLAFKAGAEWMAEQMK